MCYKERLFYLFIYFISFILYIYYIYMYLFYFNIRQLLGCQLYHFNVILHVYFSCLEIVK